MDPKKNEETLKNIVEDDEEEYNEKNEMDDYYMGCW